MLSKKHSNQLKVTHNLNLEKETFLQINQQSLAELLTFIDFADTQLTIGFVAVNFAEDRNTLIEILDNHPRCLDIQFEILNFAAPNLRFLRDEIIRDLKEIHLDADKKLVLIVIGLEKSIGLSGEYPPVLQDLNFVRDAFTNSVPHPILIFLPDHALMRLAKYAPDFWAWRKGVFYFQTVQSTQDLAIEKTIESERILGSLDLAERQERIDLLERLLMEESTDIRTRITILQELGAAYRSIAEAEKSEYFLLKALKLTEEDENLAGIKASVLHELGDTYHDLGEWDKAIALFNQSLEITEHIDDVQGKAVTLYELAGIYANKGDVDKAIALYNQSLEITERIGDVHSKAATLHDLAGIYADKGDVDKAIALYNQSLEINERIGNFQTKAAILSNLGILYANKGEVDEAIALYNQSLEITQRIGNVQGKAATLSNLGILYANKGEVDEAIALYNQSLEIKERIGDVQGKAATLHNLAGIYANKGEVDEAIALFNLSLEINERIGNVQGKANTLRWLGHLAEQQGEYTKAISYLQPALEILQRLKSPDAESVSASLDRIIRNS
ncbi:tetratricopeptide repeat protein [Nostoc sp. 'Peltigera membranacea cyanobiont' N6]|uniref:tetratricopeptide repeat protein n=1 Tax=Nostoc sp. 'Peltigera membranacea cyanobiont' N6 TaxID=1261031 RepID=UPI000D0C1215|nr:tetratricopeptide repeat protein [Nostoc sp. 'Peltigera membranacea cyanobiont' N6]AVH65893.1 TPR repeat-containing protein [Nostoc sp. 'Peltigera membranacea cyanobiont' N6]